ncbi:LacI family DNA-binding transcriptional regulator [Deinococcus sp. LM3]|uniref:LacI family DNA-binding transcriptional regulator n=1 Tax=Deinococcus sp. LM3 TaxID=1938608 RepID=UPI0009944A50|nr:LacI family DNA-binding transcriptional regulator [Deinococcus sp. LM3]OOV12050.1 LacI family transcriptional regulator [Deinococcus sp. LM3]
MPQRPTQKEIARLAGVSQTVVSQVLNGHTTGTRINPDTRARVLQTIKELGYVPNAAARRLVGGRSSLIGVFTYEAVFPGSTRDFYAPFLEGIEEEASRQGQDLLLHTSSTGSRRRLSEASRTRLSLTDGTLLLGDPGEQERQDLVEALRGGHPLVFVGRRELPGADLPHVTANYTEATQEMTQRFLSLGHRQLMYLGRQERTESAADREQGFRAVAGSAAPVLRLLPEQVNDAFLREVLTQGVTGFLVENDALMRALDATAMQGGFRSPDDFSSAVLGDAITGQPDDPHWTRLRVPRVEMGRGAVEVLLRLLGNDPVQNAIFRCAIHEGISLGPAPRVI